MIVRSLIGLPVSLAWKGNGSAIFLELGELAPSGPGRRHNDGQACIGVEWDWRVEAQGTVLYGSSNSGPQIDAGIHTLQGETITSMSVAGDVQELVIHFSNGHCLRSMAMVTGGPAWSIRTLDNQWVDVRDGGVDIGDGSAAPCSPAEREAFDMAERTANRWGIPKADPATDRCEDCNAFIPLDGNGHLLDYGCCIAEASPFDGKAVQRKSGCPVFTGHPES